MRRALRIGTNYLKNSNTSQTILKSKTLSQNITASQKELFDYRNTPQIMRRIKL